jgi:hypothetical protein
MPVNVVARRQVAAKKHVTDISGILVSVPRVSGEETLLPTFHHVRRLQVRRLAPPALIRAG